MKKQHKAYLFKVGHTTYALVTYTKARAYAYLREVMRVRKGRYKYLGIDTSTHKQQWESLTVGVNITDDWEPASTYMKVVATQPVMSCLDAQATVCYELDRLFREHHPIIAKSLEDLGRQYQANDAVGKLKVMRKLKLQLEAANELGK